MYIDLHIAIDGRNLGNADVKLENETLCFLSSNINISMF